MHFWPQRRHSVHFLSRLRFQPKAKGREEQTGLSRLLCRLAQEDAGHKLTGCEKLLSNTWVKFPRNVFERWY